MLFVKAAPPAEHLVPPLALGPGIGDRTVITIASGRSKKTDVTGTDYDEIAAIVAHSESGLLPIVDATLGNKTGQRAKECAK